MRTIAKDANGVDCLAQQPRNLPWAQFLGAPCHIETGYSLRAEQHQLCCYCEQRAGAYSSHIEHMVPRSVEPNRTYDYTNMASSCNGGTAANQHCGHLKGQDYDATRFASPHAPVTVQLFRYLLDGTVEPAEDLDGNQWASADYMIRLLGLRCPSLRGRRHTHAAQLVATLGATPSADVLAWAQAYYLQADEGGDMHEFPSVSIGLLP